MNGNPIFEQIAPELLPIFAELRAREPIFHTKTFGATIDDFARVMAEEYCEIGASGRRYSREFILRTLEEHPPVDAEAAGWRCWDFGLRSLGPAIYLLTYTLDQNGRITRRATIWHRTEAGWRILYHQGTIVAANEDDVMPTG